ncbi:MAG: DUF4160 domain-containing protein [Oscillospiraceae bacterium]|nr:DUF4160 domain-containing protein [Oscillospiraceae bacterium]
MPEISRFYGIVIKMFFIQSEHNPPHIHAVYSDYTGALTIRTGEVMFGDLPAKAIHLVQEWIAANGEDLLSMWESQQLKKLPPLS